jgi:hypothetical protein
MKFKVLTAVGGLLLAAGLVYGYTLYTSTDCCAGMKAGATECTKTTAATAEASIAPAPELTAGTKELTEEELKACAAAHGVSLEECRRTCGSGKPEATAAKTCEKGAATACCKK